VTNGARPLAPAGGHSSQVGTLLDRAVVPVLPVVVLPPVPAALDPPPPPEVEPVAEVPDVVPVAAVVVARPVCVAPAAVVAVGVGRVAAP
jgi:hypothetical protein